MALTMDKVKSLKPDPKRGKGGEFIAWDRPGFGCRVRASGAKVWIIKYRTRAGVQRRMTLGPVDEVPLSMARKEALRLLAEARLDKDPAAARAETRGGLKVSDIAERWLADLKAQGRKERGIGEYAWAFEKYINPKFGARAARSISPKDVRGLYFEIRDAGKHTLCIRVLAAMSSCLGWAQRRNLIPTNPCTRAVAREDRAKEQASKRFLSESEVSRFLAACHSLRSEGGYHGRVADGFVLMLLAALRPSEAFRLRWDELDIEKGLIRFREQKAGDGPAFLRGPALALLAGLEKTDDIYVFPSPRRAGEPVADGRSTWLEIVKLASFDDPVPGPKALRKSFATLARSWEHTLEVIKPLLRHSERGDITTAHYAHAQESVIGQAAEKIATRLAALGNPKAKVVSIATAKEIA